MAYNKKQHLSRNIEVIRTLFRLEEEKRKPHLDEQSLLRQFSGFGGLKCVLNPVNSLSDTQFWAKSELSLFPLVRELHKVLYENSRNRDEYRQYFNSIKNSVLSAFYTPPEIAQLIADSFKNIQIVPTRFLDPSAGAGVFISAFKDSGVQESTAYEKDLITGKILKNLYPESHINIEGFETIREGRNDYFDIISSNIPFGDIAVFDPVFLRSSVAEEKMAAKSVHNYFFLKSVKLLRDGGLLAFITSQGVMDTLSNKSIRENLMKECNLVSAIRLPNNLFSDYAGTEVGSDLIVLQRNRQKKALSTRDKDFVQSSAFSSGIVTNKLFQNMQRIVHTKGYLDTNLYGQAAWVFQHENGISGIAEDMKQMLKEDFSQYLDFSLFSKAEIELEKEKKSYDNTSSKRNQAKANPIQLNLFDYLDLEAKVRTEDFTPRPFQGDLFPFLLNQSLVIDEMQVGYLENLDGLKADFHPLDIPEKHKELIRSYIAIRDAYENLYTYEAREKVADNDSRLLLNKHYDSFVKKHGRLNTPANLKVLKTDKGALSVLALERYVDGKAEKADIFHSPVSFSAYQNTQTLSADEALSLSLNRSGGVDMSFIQDCTGLELHQLKEQLKGHIFFNPLENTYEIADKFLSGNVVKKAKQIASFVKEKEHDFAPLELEEINASYKALQEIIPKKIPFEQLDFNLGERWIPSGIYQKFASFLFDTDIQVYYETNMDEFSVETQSYTAQIKDQYCVKSQSRSYNGLALFRHALLNTTP